MGSASRVALTTAKAAVAQASGLGVAAGAALLSVGRAIGETPALRAALAKNFPQLSKVHLTDYKVRILDSGSATGAVTRVLIDATNGDRTWTTIGVSANIIEASWHALEESLVFGLLHSTNN